MFGWNNRPTKASLKHRIGGDSPARVFEIGYRQFEVTIPDDPDGEVTFKKPHGYRGRPQDTFPNMEVQDGALHIPLDDIVSSILSRVVPSDIAVALWADNDVRECFIEAMTTRYSEMNIGDKDRREFLHKVKEAVHSKALDRFASKAAEIEYQFGRKWHFYHEVNRINDWLRDGKYTDHDGNQLALKYHDHDPIFKIGGDSWNEARDYWRNEAKEAFSAQAIEAGTAETQGDSVHESAVAEGDAP